MRQTRFAEATAAPWMVAVCVALMSMYIIAESGLPKTYPRGGDDIGSYEFLQQYSPLEAFWGPNADQTNAKDRYYRPFFQLKHWTFLQFFPFYSVTTYYGLLGLKVIIGLVVFWLLYLLTGKKLLIAILLAAFLMSHRASSYLLILVTEVLGELVIILILTVLLLRNFSPKLWWWLAFFFLLALAPYLRENGLAVIGLGIAMGLYFGVFKRISWQHAGSIVAVSLLAMAPYLLMRHFTMGIIPKDTSFNEASLLFTLYVPGEIADFPTEKRIALYVYSITAQAVAVIAPVFTRTGTLQLHAAIATILLSVPTVLVMFTYPQLIDKKISRTTILWSIGAAAGFVLVVAGLVFTFSGSTLGSSHLRYGLRLTQAALYGVISLTAAVIIIRNWQSLTTQQLDLLVIAVLIILGFSTIAFPYFRYRNIMPQLVGLVLILIVAYDLLYAHHELRGARHLFLGLLVIVLAFNFYPHTI